MRGIVGLSLLFFGGRSSQIGAGSFHCGDLSGNFWSGSGEMRRTGGFGIVLDACGCWVLAAFGGGELLGIAIPTLIPLVFLLSLDFPCLCNDDIKSEHAHNRHTRGGESM